MVRSLNSGVAGMKTHQTRLDVIGNNIANVNTYGYKGSRATFRDIYYQTMRTASAGSGNQGGTNSMQIGYGSKLASIDVLQGQSGLTTTGVSLDVAIAGEGFFQVQDGDGNTFYTRAGMLDIDSAGNLVDLNGNFVLGVSGSPLGQAPSSDRIQISVPSVDPAAGKAEAIINNVTFTMSASNNTTDSNVTFNFLADSEMPIGEKVRAEVNSTGVTVYLNPQETIASLADLNKLVNNAITQANGGKEHPGGTFTLKMDPAGKFPAGGLTGAEIVGKDYSVQRGKVTVPNDLFGGFSFEKVGTDFTLPELTATNTNEATFDLTHALGATADDPDTFEIKVEINGKIYTATLNEKQLGTPGTVKLKNTAVTDPSIDDSITLAFPSLDSIARSENSGTTPSAYDQWYAWKNKENGAVKPNAGLAFTTSTSTGSTGSTPSKEIGLSSKPIKLTGGTEGGVQGVKDLTNLAIGPDGVIVATHAVHGRMELGRIDLATFPNSKGLQQSGDSYFLETANSGEVSLSKAGLNGTGQLASGSLEMSNVDLSQEFSDMIVTQRGFQANSRIITVSDTVLEELINLKR